VQLAFGRADFTLTVTGTGFVPGSTVEWNGTPRVTTFVSATELTAVVYASDIAAPGAQQIVVASPGPGAGSGGRSVEAGPRTLGLALGHERAEACGLSAGPSGLLYPYSFA
jgi:hypothetical protein